MFLGFLCLLFFQVSLFGQSNQVLFQEDFEGGNSAWTLNSGGPVATTGNNQWTINNAYSGDVFYPATPLQSSSIGGPISTPNGHYLHIHNLGGLPGVANTNFHPALASDAFVSLSDPICTRSMTGVRLRFHCLNGGASNAQAQVWYQINQGAWSPVGPSNLNPSGQWDTVSISHPDFDHADALRLGLRWTNSSAAPPALPSFGIDDIQVVGNYNPAIHPITLQIPPVQGAVCAGENLLLSYQQTGNACAGNYELHLLNGNTSVASWPFDLDAHQGYLQVPLPTTLAAANCYRLRLDRQGPGPVVTGQVSACFAISACPTTVSVATPTMVTLGGSPNTAFPVASGLDVPLWSTGTFSNGNRYEVELSNANGSFANPTLIGQLDAEATFDPIAGSLPGQVHCFLPPISAGCNYYLRLRSTAPQTLSRPWGPFCLQQVPVSINAGQSLQGCFSGNAAVSLDFPVTVSNPAAYGSTNSFDLEILDPVSGQVLASNFASLSGVGSGTINWSIPDLVALSNLGLSPGRYYARVQASAPVLPEHRFSSMITVQLGAPASGSPSILSTDSAACFGAGDQVIFSVVNAQVGADYQWYLNGQPFPPNEPQHPLTVEFNGASGNYGFQVQESHFGCLGQRSNPLDIAVLEAPLGTISGPARGCLGDTLWFNTAAQPYTNYQWALGNGSVGQLVVPGGGDQVGVKWEPPSTGTVSLELLQASNRCGSANGSYSVQLWDQPAASAGQQDTICYGDSLLLEGFPTATGGMAPYRYRWFPQGGATAVGKFLPRSSGNYGVQVWDANGCSHQDQVAITVLPAPLVNAGRDTVICRGDSVTLGGNPPVAPGSSFSWGFSNTTNAHPVLVPLRNQRYVLHALDTVTGCAWSDVVAVTVKTGGPPLEIEKHLCPGGTLELRGEVGQSYWWSDRSEGASLMVKTPGRYSVWTTPEVGCPRETRFAVETVPLQDSLVARTLCLGQPLEISAEGREVIWPDGSSWESYSVDGDAEVVVQAFEPEFHCPYELTFAVALNDCRRSLYLPEAFTPNGDGLNDVFEPVLDGPVAVEEFVVFDRWGRVVYQASGFGSWNGNMGGKPMEEGNYAWRIRYRKSGTQKQESGTVVLLRPGQVSGAPSF